MNDINTRHRAGFMATVLVGLLCAALAGCATTPTWNAGVTATSKSIEAAGEQVDKYEKLGIITDAQEDKLIDKLMTLNIELRRVDKLHDACDPAGCRTAAGIRAAINTGLTEITNELMKAIEEKRAKGEMP